jgi:lipase (class 3)
VARWHPHSLYGLLILKAGPSPALKQWDPGSKANPRVYSFSAPMFGNAGFAARFKRKITDYYRLDNPYDLVPHVWDPNEVREIPGLYNDQLTALRIPADALALALQVPAYQQGDRRKPG